MPRIDLPNGLLRNQFEFHGVLSGKIVLPTSHSMRLTKISASIRVGEKTYYPSQVSVKKPVDVSPLTSIEPLTNYSFITGLYRHPLPYFKANGEIPDWIKEGPPPPAVRDDESCQSPTEHYNTKRMHQKAMAESLDMEDVLLIADNFESASFLSIKQAIKLLACEVRRLQAAR